jgi:hypothetical protein
LSAACERPGSPWLINRRSPAPASPPGPDRGHLLDRSRRLGEGQCNPGPGSALGTGDSPAVVRLAVSDNAGSLRVLQKCGFKAIGTDKSRQEQTLMSMAGVIHTAPYGPTRGRRVHSLRPHRKQLVPATGPCDQTGTGGRPGLTPGRIRQPRRARCGVQCPSVAASYCWTTLAGMRPRSLSSIPWVFAQARMSPLRCRVADVRAARRD